MNRRFRIALAVTVGFTFTVVCTVVAAWPNVPREAGHICAQLMGFGIAISDRLQPNPLGHIVAAWSLDVGSNTLIYSVLFWLLVEALQFILSRRKSQR